MTVINTIPPVLTSKDLNRFWSKVDKKSKPGSCWIWNIQYNVSRYGQFCIRKPRKKPRYVLVHRLSYFIHTGIWPNSCVCHKCDNTVCVNPSHLWIGTQKENIRDCFNKGRARRAFGENHYHSKLTEEDVLEIRRLQKDGMSMRKIAIQFSVWNRAIQQIVNRKTWKHVT